MVIRANGQMRCGVKILCYRYLKTNYVLFAFKLKTNYYWAVSITPVQYLINNSKPEKMQFFDHIFDNQSYLSMYIFIFTVGYDSRPWKHLVAETIIWCYFDITSVFICSWKQGSKSHLVTPEDMSQGLQWWSVQIAIVGVVNYQALIAIMRTAARLNVWVCDSKNCIFNFVFLLGKSFTQWCHFLCKNMVKMKIGSV